MKILADFFTKVAMDASTYCFLVFFEPEVPKCLREE